MTKFCFVASLLSIKLINLSFSIHIDEEKNRLIDHQHVLNWKIFYSDSTLLK